MGGGGLSCGVHAAAFGEGSKAPKLPVVRVSGLCIVPGLEVIGGMVRIHGSEKEGPCHVRGGGWRPSRRPHSGKGADLWQAGTCPPLGVNLLTCDEGNVR